MARYSHIPIFQSTYVLTINIYKAVGNFKREHKYTLGKKLKQICDELLDLIVVVNSAENKLKPLIYLSQKLENVCVCV